MKSSVFAILAFFNLAHLRERIISVAMPAIAFVTSHLFSASVQVDRALVPPTEFVYDAPRCPPYVSRLLRKQVSPVPVIPPTPQPVCINRHLVPSFEVPGPISPAPSPWPFPPSVVKLDARSPQIPILWLLVVLVVISALSLWVYAHLKFKYRVRRLAYRQKVASTVSEWPSTIILACRPRKKIMTTLDTSPTLVIPLIVVIPPLDDLHIPAVVQPVTLDPPPGRTPCLVAASSNVDTSTKPEPHPVQHVNPPTTIPIENPNPQVPALVDGTNTEPPSTKCEEQAGETDVRSPSLPKSAPVSLQEYQERAAGLGASIWASVPSSSVPPSPSASSPSPTSSAESTQPKPTVVSAPSTPSMEDFIEQGTGTPASIWAPSTPQPSPVAKTTSTPLPSVASSSPSPPTTTKTIPLAEANVSKLESKPTLTPIEEFAYSREGLNASMWAPSTSSSPVTPSMPVPIDDKIPTPPNYPICLPAMPTPPSPLPLPVEVTVPVLSDSQIHTSENLGTGAITSICASAPSTPPAHPQHPAPRRERYIKPLFDASAAAPSPAAPVSAEVVLPTLPVSPICPSETLGLGMSASIWASELSGPPSVRPRQLPAQATRRERYIKPLFDASAAAQSPVPKKLTPPPTPAVPVEVGVLTSTVIPICPSETLGLGVSASIWASAPSSPPPTPPRQRPAQVPCRGRYIKPLCDASAAVAQPLALKNSTPPLASPAPVEVAAPTSPVAWICSSDTLGLGASASIWASEPSEPPACPQQRSAQAPQQERNIKPLFDTSTVVQPPAPKNSTPPSVPPSLVEVAAPTPSDAPICLSEGASASIWASSSPSPAAPARTQHYSRPAQERYIKPLYTAPAAPAPGTDTLPRVPLRSIVSGLPDTPQAPIILASVTSSSASSSRKASGIPRALPSNRGCVDRSRGRGRGNGRSEPTRRGEGKENGNST